MKRLFINVCTIILVINNVGCSGKQSDRAFPDITYEQITALGNRIAEDSAFVLNCSSDGYGRKGVLDCDCSRTGDRDYAGKKYWEIISARLSMSKHGHGMITGCVVEKLVAPASKIKGYLLLTFVIETGLGEHAGSVCTVSILYESENKCKIVRCEVKQE